ncbi:phosphatidylglycerol lysyltransferase domain-containing protein [Mycobacterium sp. 134]|uniref:DUF2156 domain-containing protein n=1 Tax=unclassified Mycobacterium TaxID=2642494 RepID=UPI0007FD6B2C|nr:DUF2156 domain-containing protein [Mycobacterium sp. E802]OBG83427.1 hypothetical protein A5699_03965 [Mycobacterium sp. E802]
MTQTTHDALAILENQGQSASAFLSLNAGNKYFTVDEAAGMITYRPVGRQCWIQFTGPCAATDADRAVLTEAFAQSAASQRKRIIAVQLSRHDAERAANDGWVVNQFGCTYSIDLSQFSLRGQKFVKTRNMVARSRREGVHVVEATADMQQDLRFAEQLDRIDQQWLRNKGRHVKELRLMVGERNDAVQDHRRLFVAMLGTHVVAYISFSPAYGPQPGWLYDLTRRLPDAPPGVIEHIFVEAADVLRAGGAEWIHLGLTPFVGIDPEHELPGASSPILSKAISLIRERGAFLYPAQSQLAFKLKWRPHQIEPEYIAFPGRIRLRDMWWLARATNSL